MKIRKIFKKINNLDNKHIIYIMSFLIPLILMLSIFIAKRIFPFGDRSFLRTDLYHQYAPFHSELLYKLQNFKSLLYTTHIGLGTNFITLFAYYLSSPFNILLLFVNENFLIEFITYMTVIKIALSGFTMSYYLQKRFNSEKLFIIFISIFYAMSGYMAAYYWNIMWLDCIILFPLLILGFDRAFYNDKFVLYIVSLSLTILTNYYIGVMICFFLIFYFVFLLVLSNIKNYKTVIKKLINIFIYSIIGVLISSILLIPTIYAFSTTGSSDFEFPKRINEYFHVFDVLARHLPNVKIENGLDHWPNIFCGTFSINLFILYLYNKKYTFKEKITYLVFLLFLIASFSINYLNFFWHIFKFPNSLPARQSFIYVFLVLVISFKSLNKIKNINKKDLDKTVAISIIFVLLLEKVVVNDKVPFMSFFIGIIFILIYYVLLRLYIFKKKDIYFYIALVVVMIEAFSNMFNTSITTINRTNYVSKYQDIKTLTKKAIDINNDYFRIERMNRTAKDDGAFFNFPSASIFSSTAYKDGTKFFAKVGCEASMNAYSITGSTPFINSLFGIKYALYDNEVKDIKDLNLRFIDKTDNQYLYENIDTLPLSFVLENDFLDKYVYDSANPATVQNNFARSLDLSPMLEKINVDINSKITNFKINMPGDYYMFVRDKSIEEVSIHYPTTTKTYKNLNRGYLIELGYLKEGEEFEVRNDYNDNELLIEVFRFNFENFKKVNQKILEYSDFQINFFNDTNISYDLTSKIDGSCFLSLIYDDSWDVFVDGEKVNKKKIFDCFLGFDIKKGNHKIVLKYFPNGLKLGIILSLVGIFLFGVLIYMKNTHNNVFKIKK